MGLDITAYKKIVRTDILVDNYDYNEMENHTIFTIYPEYKKVALGINNKYAYTFEDELDFHAGSYTGYNQWREWLARIAGYSESSYVEHGNIVISRAASCWNGEKGPFKELIDFSDCEGTIDWKVSRKLVRDFKKFKNRADAEPNSYYCEKYMGWMEIFEFASDGGAVAFH
jgi:hypothetical protein